jgi:hypothetical protein
MVLSAKALPVSWVEARAAVAHLAHMIGEHAVIGGCLWAAAAAGFDCLAAPTGAPTYRIAPCSVIGREIQRIGPLGFGAHDLIGESPHQWRKLRRLHFR